MYNSKNILPYKQVTKLNTHNNCRLDFKTCDLKSLFFWFDQLNNVIPNEIIFIKGKEKSKFTGIYIIQITDDEKLDNKIDYDNCLMLHYNNTNLEKFRNLLRYGEKFENLVGYNFIDWSHNKKLIQQLKNNNSEYIELNYYILQYK